MINSKEARAEATGKDNALRAECEADLDAAIRAAAALGQIEITMYKQINRLIIMKEIAEANGFSVGIHKALDQRDTDRLIVRW